MKDTGSELRDEGGRGTPDARMRRMDTSLVATAAPRTRARLGLLAAVAACAHREGERGGGGAQLLPGHVNPPSWTEPAASDDESAAPDVDTPTLEDDDDNH